MLAMQRNFIDFYSLSLSLFAEQVWLPCLQSEKFYFFCHLLLETRNVKGINRGKTIFQSFDTLMLDISGS